MTASPPELGLFSLEGRTALVTGASRGIGAAIAVGLAEAGTDVALVARTGAALEQVAARVRAVGRRTVVIEADVTVADEVEGACDRGLAELGGIDVLVNNAGGPMFHAPVLDVRDSGWQKVLDLNLTSVFRFSRRIGAAMAAQRSGSIINITAPADKGWPAVAAYSAAKAAVQSLTQSLAAELATSGVRVNALAPGWVRTAINEAYLDDGGLADVAVSAVPLRRWAEPEEMVGTAVWLASDASRYVTAAIVPVDGGFGVGLPDLWLRAMDRSQTERHPPAQPGRVPAGSAVGTRVARSSSA